MLAVLAVSLAMTFVLEEAFALAWGIQGRKELALVALVNILTNPPAALLYHTAVTVGGKAGLPITLAVEIAAVLIEWRCYKAYSEQVKRPFLFSLLANGFSYGSGIVLNRLLF